MGKDAAGNGGERGASGGELPAVAGAGSSSVGPGPEHLKLADQGQDAGLLSQASLAEKAALVGMPVVPLTLTSMPRRGEVTKEMVAGWEKVYRKGGRQLRRWVATGETAGDPCPLDDPAAMPGWWAKHFRKKCPQTVLEAAASADPKAAEPPPEASYDLSEMELGAGEAMRQAQVLVKVAYKALEDALRFGRNVDLSWQRYNRAQENLRKVEKDELAAQKARGDLLSLADVEADVYAALEMLHLMASSFSRRVLEHVAGLSPELSDRLRRAMEIEREKETQVFRQLRTVKSLDDVSTLLAA